MSSRFLATGSLAVATLLPCSGVVAQESEILLGVDRRLRTLALAIATFGVSECVGRGTRVGRWYLGYVGAYSSHAVALRTRRSPPLAAQGAGCHLTLQPSSADCLAPRPSVHAVASAR